MKRIGVIDGRGGGIGSTIVRRVKEVVGEGVEVIALGTNALATAQMITARANRGASGENAIRRTAPGAEVISGPIGKARIQSLCLLENTVLLVNTD